MLSYVSSVRNFSGFFSSIPLGIIDFILKNLIYAIPFMLKVNFKWILCFIQKYIIFTQSSTDRPYFNLEINPIDWIYSVSYHLYRNEWIKEKCENDEIMIEETENVHRNKIFVEEVMASLWPLR